jgi:hypothetical protein
LAGQFDTITTSNATFSANNIAYIVNGTSQWIPMGQGTDNIINTIFVDTCSNVYIGGAFTTAGGVLTGPVAVWRQQATNWAPLGPTLTPISSNPTIRSISVDCSAGCDSCKVYIGGNFGYKLPNELEAYGVLMFDNSTYSWDNLGGTANHDLTSADTVYVVAKQEHGTSTPVDYLWVGGNFQGAIKYYLVSRAMWFDVANSPSNVNDTVKTITYNDATLSNAEVYIGGSFTIVDGNTQQTICSNLCKFNFANDVFTQVLSYATTGYVASISHDSTQLFFGGNLVDNNFNRIEFGYTPSAGSTATVLIPGANFAPEPIVSVFSCNNGDNLCDKKVGVASASGNIIKYYTQSTSTWSDLGIKVTKSGGVPTINVFLSGYYTSQNIPTPTTHQQSLTKQVVGIIFIVIVLTVLGIVFGNMAWEKYQKRKKVLRDLNEQQMREAEL